MIKYDNKTGKYIVTLDDGTSYSIDGSALGANELNVTTPEVQVTGKAPRDVLGNRLDREYASAYNPNDAGEYAAALMNMPFAVADMPFQAMFGEKATPFQSTMGAIGAGLSPTRWIGTGRSFLRGDGFLSPWNENNPGLTGNPYNDAVFDLLTGPKFAETSLKSATLPYRIIRNATVDRPKIAYYNLAPGNYSDFMKRAGGFAKDIITGKTYTGDEVPYWRTDAPAIKGEAFGEDLMREYFPEFKPGTKRYNKVKQYIEQVRDDAWRMRTFGEQQYGSYVPNADGTYSIDMSKRYAAFGKDYVPNVRFTKEGESVTVPDKVTSSAGNTNQKVYILGNDGNTRFGVQELTDTWDAHPFVRGAGWGDAATRLDILADKYVYGAIRNKANKLYTRLYDNLYHYEKPWGKFAYNNLGGSFLNKLRNKSYKEMPFNKQITKLANKAVNWEIKDFVGGYDPFTWHQEFPFTEVMRVSSDIDGRLKVGKVIEPGFNSTNILPDEVFNYKRTGIKPSDMKFDYSNFINNIDINNLINKTYDTNTRRKTNK